MIREKPRAVAQPEGKVMAQKQMKALGRPPPQVPSGGQTHSEAFKMRAEASGPRISQEDLLVLIHSTRDTRMNERSGSFQSGRGDRPKIRKPREPKGEKLPSPEGVRRPFLTLNWGAAFL